MRSGTNEKAVDSHAGACKHPSLQAEAQVPQQLLTLQAPGGEIKDTL